MIAENQNLIKSDLLEIVQKVTKNKMRLKQVSHLEYSGLGIAMFEPIGRFRLEIAVSSHAKEKQNGDNVVVSKLTETKYFIALADGMGHGEKANKISSSGISGYSGSIARTVHLLSLPFDAYSVTFLIASIHASFVSVF